MAVAKKSVASKKDAAKKSVAGGRGALLRSKMTKEALAKKAEESYKRKDGSGKFKKIWREEGELKFWKCAEGDHIIDIIPFLAGSQHPHEMEGEPTYVLDLWVHYGIGTSEDAIVCPNRNYGKPCDICSYVKNLQKADEPDEKEIKDLKPKRRAIYNIICFDNSKEEEKGVQIWDASHFLTEKNFAALSRNPRGGGFVAFADIDEGKSIAFTREGSGAFNTKYLGFKFVDRDYAITDEDLDEAHVLDELYDIPTNEEIKEKFQGTVERGDSVDDEMEDDVPLIYNAEEIPDPDEEEVPPATTKRKTRTKKVKEVVPEADEDEDDDIPEADEDEEKGVKVWDADEDADEDEDEDDDDDIPEADEDDEDEDDVPSTTTKRKLRPPRRKR